MKPGLTDALCTQCGLCCDGTLFADVELRDQSEADGLEAMGLEIEEDDDEAGAPLLMQPCAALRGTRCGVYAQRPECCRTFECRLLRRVQSGMVSLEAARAVVAETHSKIGRLRRMAAELGPGPRQKQGQEDVALSFRERCAEALEVSGEVRISSGLNRQRRELEEGLAAVERLIRDQFLGTGRK